ncbi:SDR family NAD(P)-dependent oxidoreductase [Acetobacterium woodii]|uniref:3-oxoacyl-[acyl-carrier-protein] reductase FabG9 n=1 Tax=Acetobacterium woodii (strain ATCC 29683 / DSM 1030 / JCM 2381 / KCTC 1655 / WB1) TaxID=931626 RepID=H6LD65_ACEWD|nr:SDR family oxidoreductase [Acetobacterium woodii]AFA49110.1 3-oxoacyl-[acyl-carrier-protein] reductase FabG9 [Acetobacterium woodii DSM 1030]
MRLENKVTLITGAGSGIGRAMAKVFAQEGAIVVIVDLIESAAKSVCQEIEDLGAQCAWFTGNVVSKEEVDNFVNKTLERFGRIDILVNNAGIMGPASGSSFSVFESSLADFEQMIDVNLISVFIVSQRVMQEMAKQGGGKVINMSSIYGTVTNYDRAGYTTSKGGVVALTRSMALDAIKRNINVNVISPGYVNSPRIVERLKDPKWYDELIVKGLPIGRVCELEEIAYAALFLAGSESNYFVGQNFLIDGGWTLR